MSYIEKENIWDNIQLVINENKRAKVVEINTSRKILIFKKWYAVASVLLLMILGSSAYYLYTNYILISKEVTQYGEIKRITLPDGSVVTLNAHSDLKYKSSWDNRHIREVWLNGEAYFSVRHKMNNQPFIVHSSGMDIEVLGTEFNVFKRLDKVKVSLNSGRIKLSLDKSYHQIPIYLKPGELVEIQSNTQKIIKKTVNPNNYSSWKEHKIELEDTPVSDIIQMMKDNYGWNILVKDSSLLSEKITGEIQIKDELKCLNALSKVLDVNIDKNGNTITIERN